MARLPSSSAAEGTVVLVLVLGVVALGHETALRPNMVVMMADDMGYGDWSLTGAPAATPHLEAFANSTHSVWFKRAYAGGPICSPTRASVISGRTPSRSCIYGVEQHILSHSAFGLGDAAKAHGYRTAFFGKWHLGSITAAPSECYNQSATGGKCQSGYVLINQTLCCAGRDGHLDVSHPGQFGFDTFVATPQCGASGTTNCGCFFAPTPHNSSPCLVGHYADACDTCDTYLECAQYYHGSTSDGGAPTIAPWPVVSGANDEAFLVDQFEAFVSTGAGQQQPDGVPVAIQEPFLAVLFFHGVHIPYVATAASRAKYAGMTDNEQDYWGTISQLDDAVGRVRALLKRWGVENRTWLSLTSDNGPEVSPANGQGTGKPFINPGRTDGLRGRKRDLTEGGIREIGIVEYPPAILANRHEERFPLVTMDTMASLLDILNASTPGNRPLDGTSLLPFFAGSEPARTKPIGWYGVFGFGVTNKNGTVCPDNSTARSLGDVPAGFDTPGHQPQLAWADGDWKLFGCRNKNNTWQMFLYNIYTDRAETTDRWAAERPRAQGMLAAFQAWQASVLHSQQMEDLCAAPVPKYAPIPGLQDVKIRCTSDGANFLGESGAATVAECASECAASSACQAFSLSDPTAAGAGAGLGAGLGGDGGASRACWRFRSCAAHDASKAWVYNWSSFTITRDE